MKFHGESCLRAKSIIERLSDGKSYVELSDPHCFFMSVPPTGMNYMYAGPRLYLVPHVCAGVHALECGWASHALI